MFRNYTRLLLVAIVSNTGFSTMVLLLYIAHYDQIEGSYLISILNVKRNGSRRVSVYVVVKTLKVTIKH